MVEETRELERKTQDEIKPSDLRPQAQYYELVAARNPKTGKESHFLYWWDKESKEVMLEEVDAGGMRVGDAPLIKNGADSDTIARRKITEDINAERKKGLKIERHQKLNTELYEKGRIEQGMLIPYFEELTQDKNKNVDDALQYYYEAKGKADAEKEGRRLRKSVSGPSLSAKLRKQEENLWIALREKEKGLRYFNHYLNKRIGVDAPDEENDTLYDEYIRYNRQLADIARLAQTDSVEEKNRLLEEYEEVLNKRLNLHHQIAEQRGYLPVKIPEEYPIGEKPTESLKPPVEEKRKGLGEEEAEKVEQVLEVDWEDEQPAPKVESETVKEVPQKTEKPEVLEEAEEVEDVGEALSASAKELKERGSYTFALKGSGAEELVRGIIPRFKEIWEEQGIKIVDFSIDFDIKPDAGQIDIDVKVKKGFFSKRIQATLMLESKNGVLNTTKVSANPRIIGVLVKSFNVQEMIEENVGGEKIHSVINEWLVSEMDARGAKLESVEFRFIPEDTLLVNVVGGAK